MAEEDLKVGADDTLSVDDTVAGLAESLRLAEEPQQAPPAERGGEPPPEGQPPAAEGAPPAEAPVAPPAEPAPEDKVPGTWRKEAQAVWANVDPIVKAEITKREGDVQKFVNESQPYFHVAKQLNDVVKPYEKVYEQFNINPYDHLRGLLFAHYSLVFSPPEKKVELLRAICNELKIDPAVVANPQAAPAPQPWQRDVQDLSSRYQNLERGVTQVASAFQEQRANELAAGIMAFAADEENHPDFWKVADDIRGLIDKGAAGTLEDAYNLAILRNPETQASKLKRDTERASAAEAAERATRVAQARKATAANVNSRGSGRSPAPAETIDETLRSTMRDIRSRS